MVAIGSSIALTVIMTSLKLSQLDAKYACPLQLTTTAVNSTSTLNSTAASNGTALADSCDNSSSQREEYFFLILQGFIQPLICCPLGLCCAARHLYFIREQGMSGPALCQTSVCLRLLTSSYCVV